MPPKATALAVVVGVLNARPLLLNITLAFAFISLSLACHVWVNLHHLLAVAAGIVGIWYLHRQTQHVLANTQRFGIYQHHIVGTVANHDAVGLGEVQFLVLLVGIDHLSAEVDVLQQQAVRQVSRELNLRI